MSESTAPLDTALRSLQWTQGEQKDYLARCMKLLRNATNPEFHIRMELNGVDIQLTTEEIGAGVLPAVRRRAMQFQAEVTRLQALIDAEQEQPPGDSDGKAD